MRPWRSLSVDRCICARVSIKYRSREIDCPRRSTGKGLAEFMRRKKQPFLETGEVLTIEGACLSADGKFKAHGLLPGELATFVPLKRQKGVWVCRAEAIEKPHSDRVVPKCEHAQTCGGCSFQHYARPAQLSFKLAWLQSLFADCQPEQWLEKCLERVAIGSGKIFEGCVDKLFEVAQILSSHFGKFGQKFHFGTSASTVF